MQITPVHETTDHSHRSKRHTPFYSREMITMHAFVFHELCSSTCLSAIRQTLLFPLFVLDELGSLTWFFYNTSGINTEIKVNGDLGKNDKDLKKTDKKSQAPPPLHLLMALYHHPTIAITFSTLGVLKLSVR